MDGQACYRLVCGLPSSHARVHQSQPQSERNLSHWFGDSLCDRHGLLVESLSVGCRLRAQVSSDHLKLDVRLVESAPLAPMSFHLDVHNHHFMLQRVQQIMRTEKSSENTTKKTRSRNRNTTNNTKKHDQTKQLPKVMLNTMTQAEVQTGPGQDKA